MNVPGNIALIGNPSIGKIEDAGVVVPNGRIDRHWVAVVPEKWTGEVKLRDIENYMIDSNFFIDRFNLKSVEYGNWMNQQDRQNYLYNTAVSFDELATVLGIEPGEVGLQKNLSMAFGARGQSKALAHFEQLSSAIINLTKENGRKGVLAHEYGHAFDNLIGLAIFGDIRFVSGDTTRKNVDKDILANGNQFQKWFELFFQALYYKEDGSKTTFYNRMVAMDSDYWENRIEIWARYFEQYISYKQKELNQENKFLSRPFKNYLKSRVYLSLDEFKAALPFAEKIIQTGLKLLLNKSRKITSYGVNKEALPTHQKAQLQPGAKVKSVKNLTVQDVQENQQLDLFNAVLGAIEVLNQGNGIDYNGYQPDYAILPSYDHLIHSSDNKTTLYKKGGLDETIDAIKNVTASNYKQVALLANHLKSTSIDQTYFNIWHFIKTYIKYDFDLPGIEEIRSPARTWADRLFRSDCEDMAIFAGSILKCMGIPFSYTIVGFSGLDYYQHIYVTVNDKDKEIVIDGVMAKYGVHPENITKRMDIQILSGTPAEQISGLGSIAPFDSYTQALINNRDTLRKDLANANSAAQKLAINKEIRKATYMIMLNGTPEREVMMHIMHVVDDVDVNGFIQFKKEADLEKIAQYMSSVDSILKDINEQELGSLKSWVKKNVSSAKKDIKKVANDVGDFVKKNVNSAIDDVKDVGGKIKDAFMKYNPATIVMRNAFLALMNLNFLKYAAKLGYGYVSAADAKARGYNIAKWANAVNRTKDVEKIFEKFGGEASNLKKAVKNGAKRNNVTFSGLGLEPTTTAALIASATGILSLVASKLLEVKPKEIDPNAPNDKNSKEDDQQEKTFVDKGKELWDKYGDQALDYIDQFVGGGSSGGTSNSGSSNNTSRPNTNSSSNQSNGGANSGANSDTPAWVMPLVITGVVTGGFLLLKRN